MAREATLRNQVIAAYARFSSDRQRDTSIDDQVALCRDYVTRARGQIREDLIFADRAISGTVVARDDFDRLMKLIERKAVDVVVTESADRLTRDIGDADRFWKLCEFHGVRLICVSDGVDSARDGADTPFAFKAVMSQAYVRDLAKKTLRGLRGQFDRDRSTGGLAYGFKSTPIWSGGREPEGYDVGIDPAKAAIVKHIFETYVAGSSFLSIAADLNREGVEPPRARSRSTREKMWRKESVRSILQNSTYIGDWSFGRRQWRKDPITRKRRYILRDEADVQRDDRPHLAIITPELFEAAQSRKRRTSTTDRPGPSGRRTAHPFSGLLFCHSCGSRMVFVGGATKAYYICNGYHSARVCSNGALVREDFLIDSAIAELRRILSSDEVWRSIRSDLEAELRALHTDSGTERERLTKDLARYGAETKRLVAFIASTDDPDILEPVRAQLAQVTRTKKDTESRLATLAAPETSAPALPTLAEAIGMAGELAENIAHDPTGFREFMRSGFLNDGKIVMEPLPDGGYRAHSAVLPMALAGTAPHKRKTPEAEASRVSGSLATVGCGGRI